MKFYYLLLLFVLTACSSGTEATTEEAVQNTQTETGEAISDVDEPISELEIEEDDAVDSDSLVVPAFAIQFDFSEEVQKTLDSGKENLLVSVVMSGLPKDGTALIGKDYYSDQDEMVYLRNVDLVYKKNDNKTLRIENLKISKEALSTLEKPNYTIGINFYSSRTSSDNNVFTTKALIEEVNTMKGKTHTVKVEML